MTNRDLLDILLLEGKVTQNLYNELIETGQFSPSTIVDNKRIYVTLILEHIVSDEEERYVSTTYDATILYVSEIAPIMTVEVPIELAPLLIADSAIKIVRAYETPSIEPLDYDYGPDSDGGWFRRNSFRLAAMNKVSLDEIVKALGVDKLHSMEYKGEGVRIAVIDSGVDPNHPMLKGHLRNLYSVVDHEPNVDELGHGCVEGSNYIFTTKFGMVTIKNTYEEFEKLYEVYEKDTGNVIVLPESEKVYTVGFDLKSRKTISTRIRTIHKVPVNGEVIRVHTSKGDWLVTPWHPCLVRHHGGSYGYKRADEIKPMVHNLALINNPVNYDYQMVTYKFRLVGGSGNRTRTVNRTVDEKIGYLLGLICADGHINAKRTSYIAATNIEKAEKIKKFIKDVFGYESKIRFDSAYRVSLNSEISNLCNAAGIPFGDKTYIINIPKIIWNSPPSVKYAFIAGLNDGDGNYHPKLKPFRMRIGTSSKNMANALPLFLSSLGIKSSIWFEPGGKVLTIRGRKSIRNDSWLISICGKYLKDLHTEVSKYEILKIPILHITAKNRDTHITTVLNVSRHKFDGYFYDLTTDTENYAAGTFHLAFVHNTHVTSIVAALAPSATIDSYKIFKAAEGDISQSMFAIERATIEGASVVNMSWGASQFDPIDLLVETLHEKYGTVFVAASGNLGPEENSITSPARSLGAIAVGSVALHNPYPNAVAEFSSRGIENDIVAYGGSSDELIEGAKVGGGTTFFRGTSQATPEVTAVAALLYKKFGKDVKDRLIASAIDLGPKGADPNFGFGLLNGLGALSGDTFREKIQHGESITNERITYSQPSPQPVLNLPHVIIGGIAILAAYNLLIPRNSNVFKPVYKS